MLASVECQGEWDGIAGAITMRLAFGSGFEQEVERFRRYVDMMD